MNTIAKIVVAIGILVLLGSCSSSTDDEPIHFVVYGTIMSQSSNLPVQGVEVSVGEPVFITNYHGSIGSAVTGSDGQYEMNCTVTKDLLGDWRNSFSLSLKKPNGHTETKYFTMDPQEGSRIQQSATI